MRFVALVSGGKDSCYAMYLTVQAGHELVAVLNLIPPTPGERDSYMYQTVGSEVVNYYPKVLEVPLYQCVLDGTAVNTEMSYDDPVEGDEVEDLYRMLTNVRHDTPFDAVCCGAIHSNYQRVRVENICARMGLQLFSPLWGREQGELLKEMIQAPMEAIIVKVACIGLEPNEVLGKTIAELYDKLKGLHSKYGINMCGEGGEYESITLDCPLFKKRIVIDQFDIKMHSNDAIAPVAYIVVEKMHLEDKPST